MTLSVSNFRKEDLFKISIQKEQLNDLNTADSFLRFDRAVTIKHGETPICCVGIKDYCWNTCIAAFISSEAGPHMISLVRLLKKLKMKIRSDCSYFFVKESFLNADRLARILGYKRTSSFFLDTNGAKYYIYNIGE